MSEPEEKIELTENHLNILRERYKECNGLSDEEIVEALLFYEARTVLEHLCYPTFGACLLLVKKK